VDVPEREDAGSVLYARVSSADQKDDLDRQVARLAAEKGTRVAKVVAEVGSGLNGHRKGLISALLPPEYGAIVVEYRDRLVRFGSEYIEAALAASGRRLIVMEPDEVKDDLVQDMIDVLTSFCARLYGLRAEKAIKAVAEP
jgi:predicted site-specific integrase-resolvase